MLRHWGQAEMGRGKGVGAELGWGTSGNVFKAAALCMSIPYWRDWQSRVGAPGPRVHASPNG